MLQHCIHSPGHHTTPGLFLAVCLAVIAIDIVRAEDRVAQPVGGIERLDPALDKLVPRRAKMEVISEGLAWCESPVWVRDGQFLLFSDIPNNSIMRWDAKSGSKLFLKPSGY